MMCWGLWLEKTMKNASIPYAAILISGLTLAYSMYVAFALTGNVFGNVKIVQLEPYGGVTASHLKNLEFWRLFVSQLIHAKQLHMLHNVSCLALLGICLARYVSDIGFFLLWFVSGAVGTLVSTLSVAPPWNLGTGASQAVVGIAAFALVLMKNGLNSSKWFVAAVCLSLVPALALDLIYAGYPKPGHLAAALIGAVAGMIYFRMADKSEA